MLVQLQSGLSSPMCFAIGLARVPVKTLMPPDYGGKFTAAPLNHFEAFGGQELDKTTWDYGDMGAPQAFKGDCL